MWDGERDEGAESDERVDEEVESGDGVKRRDGVEMEGETGGMGTCGERERETARGGRVGKRIVGGSVERCEMLVA